MKRDRDARSSRRRGHAAARLNHQKGSARRSPLPLARDPLDEKARREQCLAEESDTSQMALALIGRVLRKDHGRFIRRLSHMTPNRSTMPTHRRLCRPYLERPACRCRWLTGTDWISPPCAERALQETVHVIEEWQLEERVAAEYLQAAAGVGRPIVQQVAAHAVRHARGETAEPRVAPRDAVAATSARRAGERRLHASRSAGCLGVVLPSPSSVAIHGYRAARTPV